MWKIVVLLCFINGAFGVACNARATTSSSIICVCNATYCDTLPPLTEISENTYHTFTSTPAGLRHAQQTGAILQDEPQSAYRITLDRATTHQTILGFGGAFTDSTGINLKAMPEGAQENLLRSYFAEDGAEYSLGRVPIGGADFSTRGYTYADDVSDSIEGFALQDEDFNYKIPHILKAKELTNGNLKLLASPWAPPAWMKTSNQLTGPLGFLKEEYYQMWADYFIKFFDSYADNGVDFWGVTTQNEPSSGLFFGTINNMAWTPSLMISWINEYFGPTIRNSKYSNLKILIHDDQTFYLPFVQEYFNNATTLSYIDGVGAHWYTSVFAPESLLDYAKTDKKDIFLLQTEACAGYLAVVNLEKPVDLGSWYRAAIHTEHILRFLNHDSVGWLDWNLALDLEGGPNWVDNPVDAPIIVNATSGEFYKQPTYYVLAHFSKYIPRGSVRIGLEKSAVAGNVHSAAFLRPDGAVTVVVYNGGLLEKVVDVVDPIKSGYVSVTLPPYAVTTVVFK